MFLQCHTVIGPVFSILHIRCHNMIEIYGHVKLIMSPTPWLIHQDTINPVYERDLIKLRHVIIIAKFKLMSLLIYSFPRTP